MLFFENPFALASHAIFILCSGYGSITINPIPKGESPLPGRQTRDDRGDDTRGVMVDGVCRLQVRRGTESEGTHPVPARVDTGTIRLVNADLVTDIKDV